MLLAGLSGQPLPSSRERFELDLASAGVLGCPFNFAPRADGLLLSQRRGASALA